MNIEKPNGEESMSPVEVKKFVYSPVAWEEIRERIVALDEECFGENSYGEAELQSLFENPDNIIAVLWKDGELIGFTCGIPDPEVEGACYIETTEITASEQGRGYMESLMDTLESEARNRQYTFITRHAAIENGYAVTIEKVYEDRILETYDQESVYGPQRYFKIALQIE